MKYFNHRFLRFLLTKILPPLVFLFLAGILAIFIYYYERQDNPQLGNFWSDRFLSLLLFQEYVERPYSSTARLLITLFWVIGFLFSGTIIGQISAWFVILAQQGRKNMYPKKDHYIICNHNYRTEGIVKEINTYQKESGGKSSILIIHTEKDEQDKEDIEELLSIHDNLYFKHADPTHYDTLKEIGAEKARSIILLIDYGIPKESDAKNVLIALALRKLKLDLNGKKELHIIAELRHTKRERHLREAGVNEIISSIGINVGLLAQAAVHPQVSQVYRDLLTFENNSNEIYFVGPEEFS